MYYYKKMNVRKLQNWYKKDSQPVSLEEVTPGGQEKTEFPYSVEIVAEELFIPWALDITKDGRIFFTERIGNIRLIENGVLQTSPVYTFFPPFEAQGEGGLMGLVLAPDFENNGYFYVMYTYMENGEFFNKVVRMHYEKNNTTEDKILLDKIPGERLHNGGRLKIGPDGKLYVTTGDAGQVNNSQDMNSLAGKILRMELDGRVPSDNPFEGSYVYALGLRNPQGLDWDEEGNLYGSDHGSVAHDEINLIVPGGNYGWPLSGGEFILPVFDSGDATYAPSGIAFVKEGPLAGKLLAAALRGQQLLSMTLNDTGKQVVGTESYLKDEFGRLRESYRHTDGSIYLTTSNLDGRGLPGAGDDKILRLVPR